MAPRFDTWGRVYGAKCWYTRAQNTGLFDLCPVHWIMCHLHAPMQSFECTTAHGFDHGWYVHAFHKSK